MLSFANVLWVLAYLGVIHLLCIIFSRVSRSSSDNTPQTQSLLHPSFDDQFHSNNKVLQPENHFNFNCTILQSEDHQFDNNRESEWEPKPLPAAKPLTVLPGAAETSKYQFLSGCSFSGYIEQPQSASFKVQELFSGSDNNQEESTVSKDFSQTNDEDQVNLEEHIDVAEDYSSLDEEGEEEEEEEVAGGDFEDFDDHQGPDNPIDIEEEFSSASEGKREGEDAGIPKMNRSELSLPEKAESGVSSTEPDAGEVKEKNVVCDDYLIEEDEKTKISSDEKRVPEVEESDIPPPPPPSSSSSLLEKQAGIGDVVVCKPEMSTTSILEKVDASAGEDKESELSNCLEKDANREVKGEMTSESFFSNDGQTSRDVEAEPSRKSENSLEEQEEEEHLDDNSREILPDSNDLVSDHDFSVSSESDREEDDLYHCKDELIIFSPEGQSPRKVTFDDFLRDSDDVFYSLREQYQALSPEADNEEKPNRYFSFSEQLAWNDDEEDELERSFVKSSARKDVNDDEEDELERSFVKSSARKDVNNDDELELSFVKSSARKDVNDDDQLERSFVKSSARKDFNDDDELERSFVKSSARKEVNDDDEEEDDELERSFVKSSARKDVNDDDEEEDEHGDWLRAYEEELDEHGDSDDVLIEHLATVQKLKKEMRNSRKGAVVGLPTILEETESLRLEEEEEGVKRSAVMMDDKLEHKDRMEEMKRYYRRYWEKMRRLDMLCHQSMNAIGMMQTTRSGENDHQSSSSKNPWSTILAPNFCPPNPIRRNSSDPVLKLYRNLHRDFELVYVGQLCLSWEILKWQHYKSEELQLYDMTRTRRYNLIAQEFQQFQVLLQRFTEDETYQGPRIHNYIKNRCTNRTILQVPLLKDDGPNGTGEGQQHLAISIAKLTDIIEGCTRTFWEFLRADKKDDCLLRFTNCQGGARRTHLEDPTDADLLVNLRADLHKKERKLRAIVKSGNCIVQKFHKQREAERRRRLRHELVLAQVELRLVGRVLDMTRLTTDQLLLCHKKLNKLNFTGRIVHVDSSSFMLFPF